MKKQCTSVNGCGDLLPIEKFRERTRRIYSTRINDYKLYTHRANICLDCEYEYKRRRQAERDSKRTKIAIEDREYANCARITRDWKPIFANASL